jgi:L-lactate dehydrogenase
MKAGIVGIGAVGAATAMAIMLCASVRELVLVNRNRARPMKKRGRSSTAPKR